MSEPGEPRTPPATRTSDRGVRAYLVIGGALLLIALAALLRTGDGAEQGTASPPTPSPSPDGSSAPPTIAGPKPPTVNPALMKGSEQAPVTMVIFGDYQCPYCATFTQEQQPRLVREYVETGTLRLVWRDYPYQGEASERAAVAARAAGRQDAFWRYHDALYADPDAWTSDASSAEPFTAIAADLDLDTDQFRRDLDDPRLREAVQDDHDFALGLGAPGTPAFLIDGEAFFGAQPFPEFQQRVENARDATD